MTGSFIVSLELVAFPVNPLLYNNNNNNNTVCSKRFDNTGDAEWVTDSQSQTNRDREQTWKSYTTDPESWRHCWHCTDQPTETLMALQWEIETQSRRHGWHRSERPTDPQRHWWHCRETQSHGDMGGIAVRDPQTHNDTDGTADRPRVMETLMALQWETHRPIKTLMAQ